nr:GntR family transcriptional regulator [Microbacterium bovistercoris]
MTRKAVSPIDTDDPRGITASAYRAVRDLILSGDLKPGQVISQVKLAQALGISRTPLREALRLLQNEGLIEGEPNRRSRVAGLEPSEIDVAYGSRLLLEALGMRLTLRRLEAADLAVARSALEAMDNNPAPAVSPDWYAAHRRFHLTFTSKAPVALSGQLVEGFERADRYLLLLAHGSEFSHEIVRESHRHIYESVASRDFDEAIFATARHYARTALGLLGEMAPEFEPTAIRSALQMVSAP